MPFKGTTFTPEHALSHFFGLPKSLRTATVQAWCSDAANVIPMRAAGIYKRLKMLMEGQTSRAFKPWNDSGRASIASSAEIKQWVSSHVGGDTFGEPEMRNWLEAKNGDEVCSKTVKTYLAHVLVRL